MGTKFELIGNAVAHDKSLRESALFEKQELECIRKNLTVIAEEADRTVDVVTESITHVLANLAVTADQGKPIELLHLNSVAALLAGVEALATALPQIPDSARKQNTIRALANAKIEADGHISDHVFPVVELGSRKEDLQRKYAGILQAYSRDQIEGKPDSSQLVRIIRQLQQKIDAAMRTTLQKPKPKQQPLPASAFNGRSFR